VIETTLISSPILFVVLESRRFLRHRRNFYLEKIGAKLFVCVQWWRWRHCSWASDWALHPFCRACWHWPGRPTAPRRYKAPAIAGGAPACPAPASPWRWSPRQRPRRPPKKTPAPRRKRMISLWTHRACNFVISYLLNEMSTVRSPPAMQATDPLALSASV